MTLTCDQRTTPRTRPGWTGTRTVGRGNAPRLFTVKRNLAKQVEIYETANKTDQSVTVVIVYTADDAAQVARVCAQLDKELGLGSGITAGRLVVVDARTDNKVSASKA